MQYAPRGPSGNPVSRIGLGTATFGVAPAASEVDRMIGGARELGVNCIDAADV